MWKPPQSPIRSSRARPGLPRTTLVGATWLWTTWLAVAWLWVVSCAGPVAVKTVHGPPVAEAILGSSDEMEASSTSASDTSSMAGETLRLEDLPEDTQQVLRLVHLDDDLDRAPAASFRALDVLFEEHGDGRFAAAAVQVAWAAARRAGADVDLAASWYLLAASRAYDYLVSDPDTSVRRSYEPEHQAMVELYRRAVANYLALMPSLHGGLVDHRQDTFWDTFELSWATGPGLYDPTVFDRLLPVEILEVRGLRNRYHRNGLGTPLVALTQNRQQEPFERFLPPEGIVRAATGVMVFKPRKGSYPGSGREVELRCYDPLEADEIRLEGVTVPLAADFTTPYAYLAAQAEFTKSLLRAEKAWSHLGLFLVEPYDPKKIPVIMVHGMRSTPLAWLEMTNDVHGDPVLRDAYQVWHFTYPTSVPYLYIGSLLRDALHDLRDLLDPEGDDPAFRSLVLVGHSMGGLVSRTLVTDAGDRLWNVMMKVPPEQIAGEQQDVERLKKILLLEPEPAIDRVIFIATPHGGSGLASSFLGRLGAALASLPEEFKSFFRRLTEANPHAVQPDLARMLEKGPNSIRLLSPEHPMLQTLATLPIAPGVRYHNILGDRGTPLEPKLTDGIVPYASASIPGARSERVIYGASHDVYADPLAITEVKRILRQHLDELERAGWRTGPHRHRHRWRGGSGASSP